MRLRLPLILTCLTIVSALLVAGCGSSDDPPSAPLAGSSGGQSSTSSGKPVTSAEDALLKAAGKESSGNESTPSAGGTNVPESVSNALAEARSQCRRSARSIPDAQAKRSALATCAKIR